jgi:hypothetical protein
MSDSKALPHAAYGDPSKLCDTLRRVEREMSGCERCGNSISGWDMKGCAKGKKPDQETGHCPWWRNMGGRK